MTQFFTAFCVGSILLGSLYIICPDGNISKSVKYIFSIVFLIIVITAANIPLKSIDLGAFSEITAETDTEEMNLASAKYVFSYALNKENINFSDISFFTDKKEDGSIVITKVIITTNETKEKVISALEGLLDKREVEIKNE